MSAPTTIDRAEAALNAISSEQSEARVQAEALAKAVDELEDRLRGGDRSITPADLGTAQAEARHAILVAEGYDNDVLRANADLARARVAAASTRLGALNSRFQSTLDRLAGPLADQLVELLTELDTAHAEHQECAAILDTARVALPEMPAHVAYKNGADFNRTAPTYKPAVPLPEIDTLVGELLAAALERAYGGGIDVVQRKAMTLTLNPHSVGGEKAVSLAGKWIGARTPGSGNGSRPEYITAGRA